MKIRDFTIEQAEALRDFIIRREPARLSDLAYWMRDTDGPIDEMDASLDSLIPLWKWFVWFVNSGCPGVPEAARPESFQRYVPNLNTEQRQFLGSHALRWRAAFASESLEHYVMAVLRRLDGSARWEVFSDPDARRRGVLDLREKKTVIKFASYEDVSISLPLPVTGSLIDLQDQRAGRAEPDVHGVSRYAADAWLWKAVGQHRVPKEILPESQPRRESILLPLLDQPHVPWDAPERIPPRLNENLQSPAPAEERIDYGHWLIARRPRRGFEEAIDRGVQEQSLYPPMRADKLAAGLTRLGFTDFNLQPVTAQTLLANAGCSHPDTGLLVHDFVYKGSVRQLWIEGTGYAAKVAELKGDLSALAKSVKAELTEGH